jgi:AcrR family transcriptional regulator
VSLEVFARQGFHQTSMNDIAEAAGVTKPVLYQHFGSKRELYLELLNELGEELREMVGKATSEAEGPHQQVEHGFKAFFRWVVANEHGFDLIFSGETRRDPEFVAVTERFEREIADTVGALIDIEGLSHEGRRLLGFGIVGLAETTCRHFMEDAQGRATDAQAEQVAEQVAELLWAGLRGLRPA